uniref:PIPK domain-containing protein n=2 Tax=Calcidiscus leptoporus TaxID=127549 RepID=A0A7S0P479_9EUKA
MAHHFAEFGTVFYLLVLAVHLLRETLSPFEHGGHVMYHAAVLSLATLATYTTSLPTAFTTLGSETLAVFCVQASTCFAAWSLLYRAWRNVRRVMGRDDAFTKVRKLQVHYLLYLLFAEAVFLGMGFVPNFVDISREYCVRDVTPVITELMLAVVWIALHTCSRGRMRAAVESDAKDVVRSCAQRWAASGRALRSTRSSTHMPALVHTSGCDKYNISAALRSRMMELITYGVISAAQEMYEERQSDGHLSTADCVARGEYTRTYSNEARAGVVQSLAPRVFHDLRELAGLSARDFIGSMSAPATERFSEGRSGAWLYLTEDMRFLIKTATPSEFATLLKLLPTYHKHVEAHRETTLINSIVGAHRLKMYGQQVHVIVVCSVWRVPIHERYDLKGSTVGRGGKTLGMAEGAVRKDLDLHEPFKVDPSSAQKLSRALAVDTDFLATEGVMDYSAPLLAWPRDRDVTGT